MNFDSWVLYRLATLSYLSIRSLWWLLRRIDGFRIYSILLLLGIVRKNSMVGQSTSIKFLVDVNNEFVLFYNSCYTCASVVIFTPYLCYSVAVLSQCIPWQTDTSRHSSSSFNGTPHAPRIRVKWWLFQVWSNTTLPALCGFAEKPASVAGP